MAQYNVLPAGGGSSMWKVEKNGHPLSRHHTQENALKKAHRKANTGDAITIHRPDGTIREQRTKR